MALWSFYNVLTSIRGYGCSHSLCTLQPTLCIGLVCATKRHELEASLVISSLLSYGSDIFSVLALCLSASSCLQSMFVIVQRYINRVIYVLI